MTSSPEPKTLAAPFQQRYKYFDLIMAAFVTVLLCTNLISAGKRVEVHGFVFGAGVLFFPISYLFGDVLTEVYGYARSRKVVWAGFGALIFASLVSTVILAMPADPTWGQRIAVENEAVVFSANGNSWISNQIIWSTVFGGTWRIMLASMLGFFVGEFVNSYILAKIKIMTKGRLLWLRTIGSTLVGEACDTVIFYPVAFLGIWQTERVLSVMIMNYCLKVSWEILATPLTYWVVAFLKRVEHEDFYDYDTNFTPFSLES